MSRQIRICFPGAWYHVMNRGINHQTIFFNDFCKKKFLEYVHKAIKVYGVEIHAYCLMDNHYHLIIHTPRANISDAIRYINSSYAQYANALTQRDGPLFKGRFRSIIVSEDDYLLKLSRYIHLNPRDANIVQYPEAYKWSSYRYYLNEKIKPVWLTTSEITKRFGDKNFRIEYKKFIESDSEVDTSDKYSECYISPVYSEDKYRKEIDSYVKNHSLSAEIVGADRILVPPPLHEIIEAVALYFNVESVYIRKRSASLVKKVGFLLNKPRRIAMYVCRELSGCSLSEIGDKMGGVSYKTVSGMISRVERDADQQQEAMRIIEQIKQNANYLNRLGERPGTE